MPIEEKETMKKIITFAAILGILTGGIIFYSMRVQEETVATKAVKSLSEEILVKAPKWTDYLVPDKEPGRVYRKSNQDPATIVDLTEDSITVDWDNWDGETFKKGPDGVWTR